MDTTTASACPAGAPTTTLESLCELLRSHGILQDATTPGARVAVGGAACDSRCVRPGDVFFCKGAAFRPAYLRGALDAGAVAYACAPGGARELAEVAPAGTPSMVVSDMRAAMALVSAEAFGHPDRSLPCVGITGTKGKSTTAYMLRSIIEAKHGLATCGVIGSIDTFDGIEHLESTNTTPEAPDLWRHLANARDADLAAMVMEVSSQALKYDRTLGVGLDVACFLNIGLDHISPAEHPSFEDYFSSKLRIFSQARRSVVSLGTAHLDRVLDAATGATGAPLLVSSAGPGAVECGSCDVVHPDVWATDVEPRGSSVLFVAHTPDWEGPVTVNFPGLFNVDNALVAIGVAAILGIGQHQVVRGLAACRVPGRMELIGSGADRVLCVVDYAHNALSYQSFFSSMAREFPDRRIVALIGAPGDKALERRSELPRQAARWASHIVITEEDPGREANEDICAEMLSHVPAGASAEVVLDRQRAVARCLDVALGYDSPSLVCLLGKGDETLIHRGTAFEAMVPDAEAFRAAAAARGLTYDD